MRGRSRVSLKTLEMRGRCAGLAGETHPSFSSVRIAFRARDPLIFIRSMRTETEMNL